VGGPVYRKNSTEFLARFHNLENLLGWNRNCNIRMKEKEIDKEPFKMHKSCEIKRDVDKTWDTGCEVPRRWRGGSGGESWEIGVWKVAKWPGLAN